LLNAVPVLAVSPVPPCTDQVVVVGQLEVIVRLPGVQTALPDEVSTGTAGVEFTVSVNAVEVRLAQLLVTTQ
jgi:hypothetical protein